MDLTGAPNPWALRPGPASERVTTPRHPSLTADKASPRGIGTGSGPRAAAGVKAVAGSSWLEVAAASAGSDELCELERAFLARRLLARQGGLACGS